MKKLIHLRLLRSVTFQVGVENLNHQKSLLIKPFDIRSFLGGGVLETELRETEAWMLNCLDFNLGLPLPQQFLRWARFAEPTLVKSSACFTFIKHVPKGGALHHAIALGNVTFGFQVFKDFVLNCGWVGVKRPKLLSVLWENFVLTSLTPPPPLWKFSENSSIHR